ncbi:MarR family winged helix-turn-helix transcriptional regulator [Streptomyces sp. NPDC001930]|uniref:MarR family winged helix-turn-helix transcriptional regulator n=1 Tax=Streptomyces sp. NPDC001930 TaxID=3364625 RepID=UPI003697440F
MNETPALPPGWRSTGDPDCGLQQRTAYQLIRIGELLMAGAEDTLRTAGVRPRAFSVLSALVEREGSSQQELSRRLGLDPNVMVGVIDELERSHYAERRRNPADRRSHRLVATEQGHELLKRGDRLLDEFEKTYFGSLSDEDIEVMRRLTQWLLDSWRPREGGEQA